MTECHILKVPGSHSDDAFSTLRWSAPVSSPSSSSSSSSSSSVLLPSHLPPLPSSACAGDLGHGTKLFSQLLSLFSTLFQQAVKYRESIVQALVHRCFYTTTKSYASLLLPTNDKSALSHQELFFQKRENMSRYLRDVGRNRGREFGMSPPTHVERHRVLPSVKECISNVSSFASTQSSLVVQEQHGVAHVSMCLLENLVHQHQEAHSVLLSFLMDKIHAPMLALASKSSRAYDPTILNLPSPLILHRYWRHDIMTGYVRRHMFWRDGLYVTM